MDTRLWVSAGQMMSTRHCTNDPLAVTKEDTISVSSHDRQKIITRSMVEWRQRTQEREPHDAQQASLDGNR
jgi:hypothetical protein